MHSTIYCRTGTPWPETTIVTNNKKSLVAAPPTWRPEISSKISIARTIHWWDHNISMTIDARKTRYSRVPPPLNEFRNNIRTSLYNHRRINSFNHSDSCTSSASRQVNISSDMSHKVERNTERLFNTAQNRVLDVISSKTTSHVNHNPRYMIEVRTIPNGHPQL